MSFQGLGAFRQEQEAKNTTNESPFFRLTEKGQKVLIRPLVELDEHSINFSEKNGLPVYTQEYANPQKFWLSIVDTRKDEGACVGAEMVAKYGWYSTQPDKEKGQHKDTKFNWNPKQWVYLPVLVKDSVGDDPRVEILRLGYRGDVAQALIDFAEADRDVDDDGNSDDPYGSITDRWWTYSRNHEEGYNVRYKLTPKDPSTDVNVEDFDVPDLEEHINRIPYGTDGSEQREFLQVATNTEPQIAQEIEAETPSVSPGISQAKW